MVLGLLIGLVGTGAVLSLVPWDWLLGGGALLVVVGLLVGTPTGVWYHVRLYRAMRKRGPLPSTWWLRPDRLHDALDATEKASVKVPFYAGAAGFVMAVLGCLLVAYGSLRAPPG